MYVITVLFSIQPQFQAAFLQAVIANAKTSLAEEAGCWQFDVCTSNSNINDIYLYEVYDTKDAFQEHLASAHFLAFNALTAPWVTSKVVTAFDRVYLNVNQK
jgi:(4S)-4-hydroxy-5-phosphonooxypentane-2,3-dione isomerase